MPTPVSGARVCLEGEAAAALDEAVAVARRRCHAQTTSLHVVSALLSLPSSSSSLLRDALGRARSAAYSPRLQFKALELCFSVALDRLPSSSSSSTNASSSSSSSPEPPVSNSLMAAIKRSQANQRRNPETFHLYHHQQQLSQSQSQSSSSSPSFSGVKVELQQLLLSILDDPVVSRVFGEAGFRSCDIKFAVLRPPPASILRFPRPARCPPLFLCNFSTTGDEFDPVSQRSFSFPFSRNLLYSDGSDENCRRIGEVLVRAKGRNPLLVGAGASEALEDLASVVIKEKWASLPQELAGARYFSVAEFVVGGKDRGWLSTRFEELGTSRDAVLVSVGDLKGFLDDERQEGLQYVVMELTRLVSSGSGRIWLVGSSASYETYMKFLAKFPSVDKDWDIQLLPITSVKHGSSPKRNNLMESFVPFGGLASDSGASARKSQPIFASRCHHCNEKYEQEVAVVLKENSVPVVDIQKPNLPSWLQKPPIDTAMVKNSSTVLRNKLLELQKKWNDTCERLHGEKNMPEIGFPRIVGFPQISDKESMNQVAIINQSLEDENRHGSVLEKVIPVRHSLSAENTLPELDLRLSKSEPSNIDHLHNSMSSPRSADHTSPLMPVSTDLMLGTATPPCTVIKPPSPNNHGLSRCFSSVHSELVNRSVAEISVPSSHSFSYNGSPKVSKVSALSPSSSSMFTEARLSITESSRGVSFDSQDFKTLYRSLLENVRRQEEALCAISRVITRCKSGNGKRGGLSTKGNIWLHFLGPDKLGKRKIAAALVEILFGNKGALICLDLGLEDGASMSHRICDQGVIAGNNDKHRGKMAVDQIAGEVSKTPCSVVFLENIDKADFLVQSSLSQAIRTGRFPDSHRREVSTSNTIFVTTTSQVRDKTSSREDTGMFVEDRILSAQKWQMKILIKSALMPLNVTQKSSSPTSVFINKRKLDDTNNSNEHLRLSESAKRANKSLGMFLDLNVPFEESTLNEKADSSSDGSNCASSDSSSTAWLEDFFGCMDGTIIFKPFDFDTLVDIILKETTKILHTTITSKCKLEIDPRAMEQILAATWLSDCMASLHDWLQNVLGRSFIKSQESCNLSTHSTLHLIACEDLFSSEHHPGILLPSTIGLN